MVSTQLHIFMDMALSRCEYRLFSSEKVFLLVKRFGQRLHQTCTEDSNGGERK